MASAWNKRINNKNATNNNGNNIDIFSAPFSCPKCINSDMI